MVIRMTMVTIHIKSLLIRKKFIFMYKSRNIFSMIAALLVVFVAACDQKASVSVSSTGQMPQRQYDQELLAAGKKIYSDNCAQCHGSNAEGAPNWHKRNPDGTFPAPPLNGTGHSWHHSIAVLTDMILDGSKPGEGNMPAWKDKLSREQIDSVIQYFQSLWPDPVYAAWYEQQQRL